MAVVEEIERHLAESIASGEIGYGDKLPSRSHLAARFRASPTTVSSAIQRVSKEHNLKFIPGRGVFLVEPEKRVRTIGMIGTGVRSYNDAVHDNDPYWGNLLHSLMKQACEHDYALIAIPGTREEPLDVDRIAGFDLDCLLSYGVRLREQTVMDLRRRNIPLVLGNRGDGHLPLLGASYVDYDNVGLFHDAVRLFHDHGHRRIACVMAQSSDNAWTKWRDAFILESAKLGLQGPYEDYILTQDREDQRNGMDLEEFFLQKTVDLLDLPEPPTAIFYHRYTHGLQPVLSALSERGITLGKDLSIIGLGAEDREDHSPISTYMPPANLLGQTVIETAGNLIDNPHSVFQVDVPFSYSEKGSVGRFEVK
ncbi:MAG: substrate-binding domain-containing protein [Verrucomicrobiota bacterium]